MSASQSRPSGVGPSDLTAGLTSEPSAAFTPGPWFVDEAGICSSDRMVGMVCLSDDYFGSHEDDVPDAEKAVLDANARLIASAPDLLKALKRLTFLARTSGGTAGFDALLCDGCLFAEAAIAKATGQTVSV